MLYSQLDEVSVLPYTLVVELPPGHCVPVMGAPSALVFSVYLLLLKPLLLLTKMTHDGDMEGKCFPVSVLVKPMEVTMAIPRMRLHNTSN